MSTPEREPRSQVVNMRDLLASCAAADAVSTPPREREPERHDAAEPPVTVVRAERRDAA